MRTRTGGIAALLLALACYPTTTRPRVEAVPEATLTEVELFVPDATRALALALDTDSIPVARTEPEDGWLETDWFDSETLQPTTQRPLGMDVVKLRAWADPSRPNHSQLTVEVVYRPFADPSRAPRLLERAVPDTHRVARRVAAVLQALETRYAPAGR